MVRKERPGPSLRTLLDNLAPTVLRAVYLPADLDRPLGHPVIYDSLREAATNAGDLVLAVGIEVAAPDGAELIAGACAGGPAAVIADFEREAPAPVLAAAEAAGCALLARTAAIEWWHLCSLIGEAIEGARSGAALGREQASSLFELAETVAALLGGPTSIEDRDGLVLAFANAGNDVDRSRRRTILDRQVPREEIEALEAEGVYARLRQEPDPIDVIVPGSSTPRLAVSVRSAGEVLGAIWVAEGKRPFDANARAILREAAREVALHLHLSRHGDARVSARERQASLLADTLAGRATIAAAALGFEGSAAFSVIAASLPELGDDAEAAIRLERIAKLAALYARTYRVATASTVVDGVLYLAVETGSVERLHHLAESAIAQPADGVAVSVGLSDPVSAVAELRAAAAEARDAMEAGAKCGETLAPIGAVRSEVLLAKLGAALGEAEWLRLDGLERLDDYDREQGSELTRSLRAYLDAFGRMPAAAASLGLHVNTFRYRLSRAAEVSGFDLDDPGERLLVSLALAVRG